MDLLRDASEGLLTPRHARRAVVGVLALLALLLAVPLLHSLRAYRAIKAVNDRGGFVRSSDQRLLLGYPLPWDAQRLVNPWYLVRDRYEVSFGPSVGGWCGNGITLAMGPYPSSDPGDTGLWTVAELGQTRSLELQDTSVSDAGLRALAGLTLLETLYLDGTRVAGPGLAHLPGARLHTLSLARTAVDDAGLDILGSLPDLADLNVARTRVAGPGLARLARFGTLRRLQLAGPLVDDDTLRHLAGLPLVQLELTDTAVTDAGLEHLEHLPDLRWLTLCGTGVSDAAIARSRSQAVREWPPLRRFCPRSAGP